MKTLYRKLLLVPVLAFVCLQCWLLTCIIGAMSSDGSHQDCLTSTLKVRKKAAVSLLTTQSTKCIGIKNKSCQV